MSASWPREIRTCSSDYSDHRGRIFYRSRTLTPLIVTWLGSYRRYQYLRVRGHLRALFLKAFWIFVRLSTVSARNSVSLRRWLDTYLYDLYHLAPFFIHSLGLSQLGPEHENSLLLSRKSLTMISWHSVICTSFFCKFFSIPYTFLILYILQVLCLRISTWFYVLPPARCKGNPLF